MKKILKTSVQINRLNENSWKKDLEIRSCLLGRLNVECFDPCPGSIAGGQKDRFCHGQYEMSLSCVAVHMKIFCTVYIYDSNFRTMEEDSFLKC